MKMLATCFSTARGRDDQRRGDGGVGPALGHQRQHLALAGGERGASVGRAGLAAEQLGHDLGVEGGAAGGDPAQRVDEVADVGHPVLEQVADAGGAARPAARRRSGSRRTARTPARRRPGAAGAARSRRAGPRRCGSAASGCRRRRRRAGARRTRGRAALGVGDGGHDLVAPVLASSWTSPSRRTRGVLGDHDPHGGRLTSVTSGRSCSSSGSSTVTTVGPPGGLATREASRRPCAGGRPGPASPRAGAGRRRRRLARRRVTPSGGAAGRRPWRSTVARPAPGCAWRRWSAARRRRSRRWSRWPATAGRADRRRASVGTGAAGRQRGQGGVEAAVERRRVDAPGHVAQLGDGVGGVAVGGVDQLGARGRGRTARRRRARSVSLARPSCIASATRWAWVPSCRSRSMRRSVAAESSTAWARVSSSCATRRPAAPGRAGRGPASGRARTARRTHGAASNISTPVARARNVPG